MIKIMVYQKNVWSVVCSGRWLKTVTLEKLVKKIEVLNEKREHGVCCQLPFTWIVTKVLGRAEGMEVKL